MYNFDTQYKNALVRTLGEGVDSGDRTGVGTIKVFDQNFHIDLRHEGEGHVLPILQLRKVSPRIAFEELQWMMRGSFDVTELQDKNVHIWDGNSTREFLDARGLDDWPTHTIGKGYGYQMRDFGGVDQLTKVFDGLKSNPNGRRHLISFWNVGELPEMALEPCHLLYNFMVTGEYLNLKVIIRSNDSVLGNPTNCMFAGLWLTFFAMALGYKVGKLAVSTTDFHIYTNHVDAVDEMCMRDVPSSVPKIRVNKKLKSLNDILSLEWDDIEVFDYDPHPALDKALLGMAV